MGNVLLTMFTVVIVMCVGVPLIMAVIVVIGVVITFIVSTRHKK